MSKYHPSNVLYRGEAHGFEHAMELVIAECDHEASIGFDGPEGEKLNKCLEEYKAAARKCLAEYYAKVKSAADTLAAEWQKSENEDVRRIGECLASGSYESLAI